MKRTPREHFPILLIPLILCLIEILSSGLVKPVTVQPVPTPTNSPLVLEQCVAVMYVPESTPVTIPTQEEIINGYINDICSQYGVDPYVVEGIVFYESRYQPYVHNGRCVGLMQVNTYCHAKRAERLGVTDFYDPYSNILVGVDYLSELIDTTQSTTLALMSYNMGQTAAYRLYKTGKTSSYARLVLAKAEELKQEAN